MNLSLKWLFGEIYSRRCLSMGSKMKILCIVPRVTNKSRGHCILFISTCMIFPARFFYSIQLHHARWIERRWNTVRVKYIDPFGNSSNGQRNLKRRKAAITAVRGAKFLKNQTALLLFVFRPFHLFNLVAFLVRYGRKQRKVRRMQPSMQPPMYRPWQFTTRWNYCRRTLGLALPFTDNNSPACSERVSQ